MIDKTSHLLPLLMALFTSPALTGQSTLVLSGYFDWIHPVELILHEHETGWAGNLSFKDSEVFYNLEGTKENDGFHLFEILDEKVSGHLRIRQTFAGFEGTWTNHDFSIQYPVALFAKGKEVSLDDYYYASYFTGAIEGVEIELILLSFGSDLQGCIVYDENLRYFQTEYTSVDGTDFTIGENVLAYFDYQHINVNIGYQRLYLHIYYNQEEKSNVELELKNRIQLNYESSSSFHKLFEASYLPFKGFKTVEWPLSRQGDDYDLHPSNRFAHRYHMLPKLVWFDEGFYSVYYLISDTELGKDSMIVINVTLEDEPRTFKAESQFKKKIDLLDFCRKFALDQSRLGFNQEMGIDRDNIRNFKHLAVRRDGILLMSDFDTFDGPEIALIPKGIFTDLVKKNSLLSKIWNLQ